MWKVSFFSRKVWPDGLINFHYLPFYSNENLSNSLKIARVGSKFCHIIRKTLRNCLRLFRINQSGKFSPNPVTLSNEYRNLCMIVERCVWDRPRKVGFCSVSSVTRFGEILQLWQKFTSLWQFFDGLFLTWQNAEPTLANLWHYWAIFIVANGQILKHNLVTLWLSDAAAVRR